MRLALLASSKPFSLSKSTKLSKFPNADEVNELFMGPNGGARADEDVNELRRGDMNDVSKIFSRSTLLDLNSGSGDRPIKFLLWNAVFSIYFNI